MGLTGFYKGGIPIGGGFYRDSKGYINKIGGGFIRTTDGRIEAIALPYAQIPAGTVLATVNKALVSGSSNYVGYAQYMHSNVVTLSKAINMEKDIPNGIQINFDPTQFIAYWDSFVASSSDASLSSFINQTSFVANYSALTSTNGYQMLSKSNYSDVDKTGWSNFYVKLTSPTTLQFYSNFYYADGTVPPMLFDWQGSIFAYPSMYVFAILKTVEVK